MPDQTKVSFPGGAWTQVPAPASDSPQSGTMQKAASLTDDDVSKLAAAAPRIGGKQIRVETPVSGYYKQTETKAATERCDTCDGTGKVSEKCAWVICPRCGGSGSMPQDNVA